MRQLHADIAKYEHQISARPQETNKPKMYRMFLRTTIVIFLFYVCKHINKKD